MIRFLEDQRRFSTESKKYHESETAFIPRSKNMGRFRQEYTGSHRNMKAVFRPENFWISSGAFRSLSCTFPPETGEKSPEKIRNFPAGILLPCSDDLRCIPAGSSVFSVSFLQVPSGSGHRNFRPGLIEIIDDCTLVINQLTTEKRILGR